MTLSSQRLPLGALIRNENSSIIYLVIKVDKSDQAYAYYLCRIYNPAEPDQTLPLTFNFIVGDEKAHKFTVLNSTIKEERDGSLSHSLSFIDYEEGLAFKDNTDFMLRYLTACSLYKKDKHGFEVISVNKANKTVNLRRQSTWLERFLFKPDFLVFTVTWAYLLNNYVAIVPENLDETLYMQTVQTQRYF